MVVGGGGGGVGEGHSSPLMEFWHCSSLEFFQHPNFFGLNPT